MAAEREIRWFFKHILSFNIELSKLRLPLKFVRSLNNPLPDTVKVHAPDKRVWTMKVVEEESHIWLEDGFGAFARHYSLNQGHQVHFEHTSRSNFRVRIFDKSCCEIPHPPSDAPPNPTARKPEFPNFRSDSRFLSPRHFKSKRPFFEVKMKSYNTQFSVMYVPELFRRRYMAETRDGDVKLEVGDERQWKVNLRRKSTGRLGLGKGWNVFYEENKLKEGDVCIFELLKGKEYVFKVFIFVAVF